MAAALATTASVVPAVAEPGPAPESVWGKAEKVEQPTFQVGTNTPPESEPSARLTPEEKSWTKHELRLAESGAQSAAAPSAAVPEGQGEVPWHQISDTRLTDSLVARVNFSNGNLMLARTDFDIAGVGQQLQLTQTYNSLPSPHGKPALTWWFNYERRLDSTDGAMVLFDHTGASVRFEENSNGSFATPAGYSKDLVKDDDGTYQVTDRKSGMTDHFNADGVLTEVTDRNDGKVTVTRSADGGFTVTDERTGRWVEYAEVVSHIKWQAKDNTGRTVTYNFDTNDNLVGFTDAAGKKTVFAYDAGTDGRIWKVTSPEGRETVFTYDAHDRVTSMQRRPNGGKNGPTWTYAYSSDTPGGEGTTTVADPDEDETVYHYNDEGGVTKVVDPLGHERSQSFDAQHNVVTATDAMGIGSSPGNVTTYGWDSRNNPTSAQLPTGATASLTGYQTIAGADLPGTLTSADGEKTSYEYDAKGNTLSVAVSGDEGGTRDFEYNDSTPECGGFEGQRCSAEDANNNKTSFTYDAKGNLTKAAPPAPMGATTYTYDALGRPATVTDGRGTTLAYTYDARDRVTKVAPASGSAVTYTYDGDGNRTSRTDATGTTQYTYDGMSRETVRTLRDGSQTVTAYTASEGNVDYYQDPAGTVDYTYDAANRLTKLHKGTTTTYEYNANNQRTKTIYPGNVEQKITLDESGRPTRITATSGNSTYVDLSYDYAYTSGGDTKDGTKIRIRTNHRDDTKLSYDYGSQGRLAYAEETHSGEQTASWRYCFDPAGNLTSTSTSDNSCPGSTSYTYNDASQLTAKNGNSDGWSYDKAGNETAAASSADQARTDAEYSAYNQLTEFTAGGTRHTAQYAGTTNTERVTFDQTVFYHGQLGLAATAGGQYTEFTREPSGTLNSANVDGKRYWYLTDALGSVVGMVDGGGNLTHEYAYTPTGVDRGTPQEQKPQPYRFAGTYKDPTGLYKMGARYYDPHLHPTRPQRPGNQPLPLRHRRPHQPHRSERALQLQGIP
ncbi:DUF6531 domain-containing protein [Streptomyces sp. JJ66]|uniref:DUF6531 domain-containing protein n=1 Tax=Streptomyces sp. JJ66 TaxID=2803843 RepID=UPI0027E382FB|nr:DUF6531 domain-containing protein [Streptomyces sp. JJ66]